MRSLIPLLGAALALGACVTTPVADEAKPAALAEMPDMTLERVVMLMRHGVRPPTKDPAETGVTDEAWPTWSVPFGALTPHGYDAVKLLGQWDRTQWVARGILPAQGCPSPSEITVAASFKSRTQDTARALVEGMLPGCTVAVAHPASEEEDAEFHPLEAHSVAIDSDAAFAAQLALAPPGGLLAERERQSGRLQLLSRVLGCCTASLCAESALPAGCDLSQMPVGLVRNANDRADVGQPFGTASTASQTLLLEYLEGFPMSQVGWGRVTRDQIEDLLELNTLKFRYEGRAPYVAARAASPLMSRMLTAMESGPKLTVLAGHDTNIADLGGMLDLHWHMPTYPRDNPPPGGALGFEVLKDASGARFVRAFYRAQTMDQIRYLQPLTGDNAPSHQYLDIPGCDAPCPLPTFERIVRGKLVASAPAA